MLRPLAAVSKKTANRTSASPLALATHFAWESRSDWISLYEPFATAFLTLLRAVAGAVETPQPAIKLEVCLPMALVLPMRECDLGTSLYFLQLSATLSRSSPCGVPHDEEQGQGRRLSRPGGNRPAAAAALAAYCHYAPAKHRSALTQCRLV